MPAVEFQNPAGNIVQKIPVVRNGDYSAGKFVQESFEPGHRFRIEMIGRFVEQQNIGALQQQPAQRQPTFFPPRQVLDNRIAGRHANRIAGDIDPAYADAFTQARDAGVEVIAYDCEITPDGVSLGAPLRFISD